MMRKIKRVQAALNGIQYIVGSGARKELSPFVFFDAGSGERNDEGLFIGMHPHSGIAIITYLEGAELAHGDSSKNDERIYSGGAQWIRSGGGLWHEENYFRPQSISQGSWPMSLHQLWLQLPPELEESTPEYKSFQAADFPLVGSVKVIVGSYEGQTSPLKTPYNMSYFDIALKAGERFSFLAPTHQEKGFVFPRQGSVQIAGTKLPLEHISILEESDARIEIEAVEDARFVLLLAEEQNYPQFVGGGSIHTSQDALKRSQVRIQDLGNQLA